MPIGNIPLPTQRCQSMIKVPSTSIRSGRKPRRCPRCVRPSSHAAARLPNRGFGRPALLLSLTCSRTGVGGLLLSIYLHLSRIEHDTAQSLRRAPMTACNTHLATRAGTRPRCACNAPDKANAQRAVARAAACGPALTPGRGLGLAPTPRTPRHLPKSRG